MSKDTENLNDITSDSDFGKNIKSLMNSYFKKMADSDKAPENIYEMIMSEAEVALIEDTMALTDNNQRASTIMLGINRGTLRKKLHHYGIE